MDADTETKRDEQPQGLSNAEIADRLASLAQPLSTQKENPYKVKAYRRAAARIRTFAESLDEMVRQEADLTRFAGIGAASLDCRSYTTSARASFSRVSFWTWFSSMALTLS